MVSDAVAARTSVATGPAAPHSLATSAPGPGRPSQTSHNWAGLSGLSCPAEFYNFGQNLLDLGVLGFEVALNVH
jgi:hypothetical protein